MCDGLMDTAAGIVSAVCIVIVLPFLLVQCTSYKDGLKQGKFLHKKSKSLLPVAAKHLLTLQAYKTKTCFKVFNQI